MSVSVVGSRFMAFLGSAQVRVQLSNNFLRAPLRSGWTSLPSLLCHQRPEPDVRTLSQSILNSQAHCWSRTTTLYV